MKKRVYRQCIIEARHPDHGNNWDSDYVASESYTIRQARAYLRELLDDPEWAGWEFRIMAQSDGCYCERIAYDKARG